MKLLFLADTYRYGGGGVYSILKFAEHLSKNNDVTVVTNKNALLYIKKETRMRVILKKEISMNFKGHGILNNLVDNFFTRTKLENLLRIEKFDFIIGYLTGSAIKAVKLGKKFRIPVANFNFETPQWLEEELGNDWRSEYKGKVKKAWDKTKSAYRESDILLANSKLSKIKCEEWIGKQVTDYVYPGVELTKKNNFKKKNQVIYVGRLIKSKNVDLAIKALSLTKNAPVLAVIGNGPEKTNLVSLSHELKVNVEFLGAIQDIEKWKEICSSKFMIFPSSFEGFGMPPMEALICGIPCICADIPILREVYNDKVEYFKKNDVKELRKQIEFLLANPGYCMKRGKEGEKFVKNNFGWKKSSKKIEKILLEYKNGKKY